MCLIYSSLLCIEFGKKPVLIKIPSTTQNKDDDLAIVKDELQQLEEEMNHFKGLVSSINMKLNRFFFVGFTMCLFK